MKKLIVVFVFFCIPVCAMEIFNKNKYHKSINHSKDHIISRNLAFRIVENRLALENKSEEEKWIYTWRLKCLTNNPFYEEAERLIARDGIFYYSPNCDDDDVKYYTIASDVVFSPYKLGSIIVLYRNDGEFNIIQDDTFYSISVVHENVRKRTPKQLNKLFKKGYCLVVNKIAFDEFSIKAYLFPK